MLDSLYTFTLFYILACSLPLLALSYIVLSVTHKVWLFIIAVLHPQVKFLQSTTVRTLLDTHRNQGIISVLLCVKGQAQPDAVRRHLEEVIRRRDKWGNLYFPRLRHCLVARCGTYAWERGKFDLDQNITVAPLTYKGRSITEYNIQEYVSEIVSKYLPSGVPPWQIFIIASSEYQHYILLKLHHVLLNEGLNIGDFLPLVPPARQSSTSIASPLMEVLPKPEAIPKLKQRLDDEVANFWNEFVASYDPLERIELLKSTPNIFQFCGIFLVAIISSYKEVRKGWVVLQPQILSRMRFATLTLKRECHKRGLTSGTILKAILATLDPRRLVKTTLKYFLAVLTVPLRLYVTLIRECWALFNCLTQSYCQYNGTLVGACYNYVPLVLGCIKECGFYLNQIILAPRVVLEDIVSQRESFQTITLCGRKSVAWSDVVKLDVIRTIAQSTNSTDVEIMLAAVSASISKYFTVTKHLIPEYLPVAMRNVNSNYIFATGTNLVPENSVSGILCVNLPILDPEKDVSVLENLFEIKENFRGALSRQGVTHLLSWWQTRFNFLTKVVPLSLLGVYLRYLSRKYAVVVTEMASKYPGVGQRTLWGQEVSGVVFWRPPQANSSVSLCLNEYGDHVRLGVMCDSQLAPHHPLLARGFPEYIQDLARSVGIK